MAQGPAVDQYLQGPAVNYFFACDGYGEPTKSGDGMATYGATMGIFMGSGDRRRVAPTFGSNGIAACDASLIKLQTFPDYWMRRVSLFRARAIHRLATNDFESTFADLDAAQSAAVGGSDPLYQRSLGLGIDLIRAMALRRSGDQVGGEALAARSFEKRPYSRQTAFATLTAMGPEASFEKTSSVLHQLARIDPSMTGELSRETFEHGRFAEVLQLYPGLTPPVKLGDEPIQFRQRLLLEQENRATAEAFWAEMLGRKAYALAALGQPGEARATIDEARHRMARATPPAPPLPANPKTEDMTRNAVYEQSNLKIRTTVPAIIDEWAFLVEARALLSERKYREAVAWLNSRTQHLPGTWASIDLIEALGVQAPVPERPDSTPFRASLSKLRQDSFGPELTALFTTLPETETSKRLPPYRPSGGGLIRGIDGYKETKPQDRSGAILNFYGPDATLATMEEAALLRVAELAAEAGSSVMIVTARKDIERTTINTMYGSPIASFPSGYETQLDVKFINPGAVNPNTPSWRLIDVGAVRATLGPSYHPEAPRKRAEAQ